MTDAADPRPDPPFPPDPPQTPTQEWWEDPELASAVAEVEHFAADAGWDRPPRLFALVPTDELRRTQPELTDHLADSGTYTSIAQDEFDATDLEAALAAIVWPDAVVGCALVQEILVLPPAAADEVGGDDAAAATHPDRTEARLVAGVLRGQPGGACLLRVRHSEEGDATEAPAATGGAADEPLRGGDLAPGLIAALQATFR